MRPAGHVLLVGKQCLEQRRILRIHAKQGLMAVQVRALHLVRVSRPVLLVQRGNSVPVIRLENQAESHRTRHGRAPLVPFHRLYSLLARTLHAPRRGMSRFHHAVLRAEGQDPMLHYESRRQQDHGASCYASPSSVILHVFLLLSLHVSRFILQIFELTRTLYKLQSSSRLIS